MPKLTFIHIPRTAGTTILQGLTDKQPTIPLINLGHTVARSNPPIQKNIPKTFQTFNKNILNDKILFMTIRNPFSWLLSYTLYISGFNPKYDTSQQYDTEFAKKGFNHYLQTITKRTDLWPCQKLLFFQLFSDSGEFLPDFVAHVETLNDDLKAIASEINLPYVQKPKQRVLGIGEMYNHYYTPELKVLVESIWKRELYLFGYSYQGLHINNALIKRKVSPEQKKSLQYEWSTDELYINGKLYT
jgi:hypothetical protein